jgi:hypothetical protein
MEKVHTVKTYNCHPGQYTVCCPGYGDCNRRRPNRAQLELRPNLIGVMSAIRPAPSVEES